MLINDHVNSFNKILADFLNLNEKFEDEDKALLNMTISAPLCFIGRIVSHSMLYAVCCTTLRLERKTERITGIQLSKH